MPKTWPKVILDPVHNLIPFTASRCDTLLLDLINTREFQRLRRIKQLGMSELVFPGANHSRFAHSIGVMHVARLMLDRLEQVMDRRFDERVRLAASAAALLYDVGHGPFSHAFEKVTGEKHEARTLDIIRDDSTEVQRLLVAVDSTLPQAVALFIEQPPRAVWEAQNVPWTLRHVVSGQLDADRLDYLLRDSLATGTLYGRFDLNWLLLHLKADDRRGLLYLGSKAKSVVETYVFARHHMYNSVYFHKTTRAAEVMLRLVFARYRELLERTEGEAAKTSVVPDAPAIVLIAFSSELSLANYLALDDFVVSEFLKGCEAAKDKVIAELGGGLAHRRLYKSRDVAGMDPTLVADFAERLKELARERGLVPAFTVVADTAADIAYRLYNPAEDKEVTQIFIEDPRGAVAELSNASEAVRALSRPASLVRYYVPEVLRADAERVFAEMLKRS